MAMSDLAEAAIGENAINGGSESIPGTWYLALFKSGAQSTLETGSASKEVQTSATAGYNRQAMAISDDSSGGTISYSNAAAETFTASGSAWPDVYFVGLCESQTPGTDDVWYYGPLTTAITNIGDGSSVQFAIGEIDIPVT